MAIHSSVLAWRIPGTGEPGGLPCMGWHRVGHNWSNLAAPAAAGWLGKALWWYFTEETWSNTTSSVPYVIFTFKRKPLWKPKELHGVLHKWLTFDYLFEFHMESHWQCGLFQGLTWFLFSFLILSHCILYQLLLHHYEVGMKCGIAVCKHLLLFLNYKY